MRHTLAIALSCCAAAACSGSGASAPSTSGTSPAAVIVLSMTPDPVVEDPACLCGGLPNRVSAIGRLTVRETAGVGVRIDSLRATLRNSATGATTFTSDFTQADVAGHAGGVNRVAASGSLNVIDVGGHYDRGLSGAGILTIEVRGTDDRGNAVTAQLVVAVSAAPG
jgi:hypothetical protein